jgi:hypothetical protein
MWLATRLAEEFNLIVQFAYQLQFRLKQHGISALQQAVDVIGKPNEQFPIQQTNDTDPILFSILL